METKYSIERYRINSFDSGFYITVDGYAVNSDSSFPDTAVCINGVPSEYLISRVKRPEIVSRYDLKPAALMCGFRLVVQSDVPELNEIRITFGEAEPWIRNAAQIEKAVVHSPLLYYVEHSTYDPNDNTAALVGWAVSLDHKPVSLKIIDAAGNTVKDEHRFFYRRDMSDLYYSGNTKEQYGFNISFHGERYNRYTLVISNGDTEEHFEVFSQGVEEENQSSFKRLLGFVNTGNLKQVQDYVKNYGFTQTVQAVARKLSGRNRYHEWFKKHRVKEAELKQQREHVFDYAPKISLLVPVYDPPEEYFRQMVESVKEQSYANWQLCLADGSDDGHPVKEMIRKYADEDERIRYVFLDQNYGISGNTNKALELADGEYIGLFDHDDLLEKDALYEIVSSLQETRHDAVYTDEDKLNSKTKQYETPTFKPDFDITLLRSENYITHFFVAKAEVLKGTGGFHSEYDGAQDLDVILRCSENAESVYHIPKVLYHWRMHAASTAEDPASKLYCYEAGEKAVNDHLKRTGKKGHAKYMEEPLWGTYQVTYETEEMPLVSIVLLNVTDQDQLNLMMETLRKSGLTGYETILCQYEKADLNAEDVRVFHCPKNMKGKDVKRIMPQTRGEYILFIDNAVPLHADAITQLIGYCRQEDTAAAAGKVLAGTDEVKDSFRVIGLGDFSADVFIGLSGHDAGHLNRSVVSCECSAAGHTCLMVKKSSYQKTEGFRQQLALDEAFVDLCLQMRANKEKIVYVPYSMWKDIGAVKYSADEESTAYLKQEWKDLLKEGDPYYSPNFDSQAGPFIFR